MATCLSVRSQAALLQFVFRFRHFKATPRLGTILCFTTISSMNTLNYIPKSITYLCFSIHSRRNKSMAKGQSKWTPLVLTGIIGVILYCTLTYISILHYPGFFDPFLNFLSRLGNSSLNPTGAIYYNLAVISAGSMLFLTYLGVFTANRNSEHHKMLIIATAFGLFNAFTIIMAGVFNEDIYTLHFIFSFLIFATWIPVLISMNYILFNQGGYERGISYYGFVLAALNIVFVTFVLSFGTSSGSIIEWISIFSFQSWVLLLVLIILWQYRTQSK